MITRACRAAQRLGSRSQVATQSAEFGAAAYSSEAAVARRVRSVASSNEKIEILTTKHRCPKSEIIRFAMFFVSKHVLMYPLSKTTHFASGRLPLSVFMSAGRHFDVRLLKCLMHDAKSLELDVQKSRVLIVSDWFNVSS